MNNERKLIITVTGPMMMYRLDLMKKSSPDVVKNYLLVFTDRYSYEIYKKNGYDDHFTFVIMDDIRKEYAFSLEYEKLLEIPTEEEYIKNIRNYYNKQKNRYYPYDIHRFIFPYLAEKGIFNFALICSDFVLNNSTKLLETYFDRIQKSTTYIHWFDEDLNSKEKLEFFKKEMLPLFPDLFADLPFYRNADGFIRGFHFKNKEDLLLFFNAWNKCIEILFTKYFHYTGPHTGEVIQDMTWVCPYIMQYFQNKNYEFLNSSDLLYIDNTHVGRHITKPEDTFYLGPRWTDTEKFNYSDTGSISSFIKNNKEQLRSYYSKHINTFEITNTHVYTSIS